jgi:ESCRT-I complex subunit VPS28
MDAIKIEYKSVDQLQPIISNVQESLSKCNIKDFEGKAKIKNWLIKLNGMKAHEELNDDEIRQLLFDLESAYNSFHSLLE